MSAGPGMDRGAATQRLRYLWLAGFIATIPTANWLIQHVGTTCVPAGPCLVPVAPGMLAPSGVLVIGLALVLRDAIHWSLGAYWSLAAIAIGTVLSILLAPPALVLASGLAFMMSELADFAVYAPLRRRWPASAILVSGLAGAIVDSALFLGVAFGSLAFLPGQVVGKLWMSLLAAIAIAVLRRRRMATDAGWGAGG